MRKEQEELDKHRAHREAAENKSNRTIAKTDRPERKKRDFFHANALHTHTAGIA